MEKLEDKTSDIRRIYDHYVGLAEVISHYPRLAPNENGELEELLKIKLKLKSDFFSVEHDKVMKNYTAECTVYGNGTNHVQIKKKLKKGDIIMLFKLDYEHTKHKYHDYIIRDSQLVTPASVSNGESDDTLGNWM
jgi:hypothetical protein